MAKERTNIVVWGGAGQVGLNTAEKIAYVIGNMPVRITLVDIPQAAQRLEGLDQKIWECAAAVGTNLQVSHTTTEDTTGIRASLGEADMVINAAGYPRGITLDLKDGKGPVEIKTREQINQANASITGALASHIRSYARNQPLVIQVANQADTQARLLHGILTKSGYDGKRIMSMNYLDQARLRVAAAHELNVPIPSVHALLGGTHDDFMVPLYSQLRVDGKYVELSAEQKERITKKTIEGGAWMLGKMGKTSEAEPGACVAALVRAVLHPNKYTDQVFSLGVYLHGEWGPEFKDGLMGLPCTLSRDGAVPIARPKNLDQREVDALLKALVHSREMYGAVRPLAEKYGVQKK